MKSEKSEAPHRGEPAGTSLPKSGKAPENYHTQTDRAQALPRPGTALTAFLRKYRVELYPYRHHDHGQRLLTAILVLLNEAER